MAFVQLSVATSQEMDELNGSPGQHADAAGTVRSKEPLMVVLSEIQSSSEGHEGSRGDDLHTGAV